MEILSNDFTLTFTNTAAAVKAKQIADQSLHAFLVDDTDILFILDDMTLTYEESSFFSEDLMGAARKIVEAIANGMKSETFEFYVSGSDTYTAVEIEGTYQNGMLDITTTFFPEGYSEYLSCPECGEDVVRMEDYDPNKTYVCPECGEEIDFSAEAPEIEKECIKIF